MSSSDRVRTPRLRVLVNGTILAGAISAEVVSTNYYGADQFRVRAVLNDNPANGAAFWAATDQIEMDVQIGFDSEFTSLVQGSVDSISMDPVDGTVELEGRDFTASLIEARTHETFTNQTASEIATVLADRHGLLGDVQVTTTPVGRYWQIEHDRITLDQFSRATTEWDLLIGLAAREGFDVWVSGHTLHFRARNAVVSAQAVLRAARTMDGPVNIAALHLRRALTLARDIEVVVKSWNSRAGQSFTETARATRSRRGGKVGAVQRYNFIVPDLLPDAALQLAQRKLAELSRHERVIGVEMPGELFMDPRMVCSLEGSGTAFDQDYWIDEITRSIDQRDGFRQFVTARNISPGVAVN